MAKSFEDLEVWKKSVQLYLELSSKIEISCKEYFFKDQILRACLSISNNIAEGFERQTDKELVQFFFIARWSSWEVRSMLYLAKDKWYLLEDEFSKYKKESSIISAMLYKLILYYKNKS
jgi:four helix bundle protein